MLIYGDIKLASFGIENDGDFLNTGLFLPHIIVNIRSDYIKSVDLDNFYVARQMHYFCHTHGNSQAGEAARPDRYIEMLDIFGFSVEAV